MKRTFLRRSVFSLAFLCCMMLILILPVQSIDFNQRGKAELAMTSPTLSELSYQPKSHNFANRYEGVVANTSFQIWNSGCCGLTYSIIEECSWITVFPTYGHSYGEKDTIRITINTTGLQPGFYRENITIDSSDMDAFFMVSLTVIEPVNLVPNDPVLSGPSHGRIDVEQTFYASSTDPENGQIWYQWDMGNGSLSSWKGPYASGTDCSFTYTWSEEGIYQIKARAKDDQDQITDWSDPLSIKMPRQKMMFPFLSQLMQRFFAFFY